MHGSVAGRTRRLDPCRTCRESDRQATGTVVLLSEVADADSPETISLALAPAHFPHTPPCAWARGYFDELTGPAAEDGTGPSIQDPNPPTQGAYAKGTEVACGMSSPRRTARGRYYARLIRHSEDLKVALNWHYCRSVAIQTLGLFGIYLRPLTSAATATDVDDVIRQKIIAGLTPARNP